MPKDDVPGAGKSGEGQLGNTRWLSVTFTTMVAVRQTGKLDAMLLLRWSKL